MRLHLAGMLALCRALQRASVPRAHQRGLRATVATPPPAAPDAGVAAQVEAQGALIRDLKEGQGLGNKSPEVVAAVAELVRLKALLEPPPDAGGDATEAYAELRVRLRRVAARVGRRLEQGLEPHELRDGRDDLGTLVPEALALLQIPDQRPLRLDLRRDARVGRRRRWCCDRRAQAPLVCPRHRRALERAAQREHAREVQAH